MAQPRAVLVDLPLGHTTGAPHDPDGQRRLLRDGLEAGVAIQASGTIVDLPFRWVDDGWKANPLGWSRSRQDAALTGGDSGDTRTSRSADPVYQSEADREAAAAVPWDDQCLSCLGIAPEPG